MNLVPAFCGVPFVLRRIHFFTGFVESGVTVKVLNSYNPV